MTRWQPRIARRNGPIYRAIAEALAADIASGRLGPRERLPAQRDLAHQLGVTVMTVTRAYAEAARRGLVEGEVGRGTFVSGAPAAEAPDVFDLGLNTVPPHAHLHELAARLSAPGRLSERARLLDYQPAEGLPRHAAAGRLWLARRGWTAETHDVLVTAGAQHALTVVLMSLLPRGGDLLVEEVTYSGIRELAARLGVVLHPVALDDSGLQPADLDAVCRRTPARVLYAMPALQNPTGLSMPPARQAEIAALARRHDLTLVEDDTYGFATEDAPLLATLMPERSLVITSLSKSVAGGLRVGFLAAPPRWTEALAASIWNTVVMASPITADLGAALVEDGTAAAIAAWKRDEMRARQAIARASLGRVPAATCPSSPHVWLPLDRPWRADAFSAQARARGVVVTASPAFSVREGASPRAVRVALGGPRTRSALATALTRLAALHGEGPSPAAVL